MQARSMFTTRVRPVLKDNSCVFMVVLSITLHLALHVINSQVLIEICPAESLEAIGKALMASIIAPFLAVATINTVFICTLDMFPRLNKRFCTTRDIIRPRINDRLSRIFQQLSIVANVKVLP